MAEQCERRYAFWRYVRTMKHFRFFLLMTVVAVSANAQSALNRETAPVQTAPEQRRAELRSALKAPRGPAAPDKVQQLDNALTMNRHLSAQERAALRQQLRQQRHVSKE